MEFQFRFASLIKYRQYRCELVRLMYAQILAQKDKLLASKSDVELNRHCQFSEMRILSGIGVVNVDGAVSRRFYAGQLSANVLGLEREIQVVEQQLQSCRNALLAAEQGVETLTRLAEKQRRAFEYRENRHTQLELEDSWMSARTGDMKR